jgi:nicotinamidase-related amidase
MTTVLLLVDVQRNMLEPPEPVPQAETVGAAIEDLLERARSAGVDGDPHQEQRRSRRPG